MTEPMTDERLAEIERGIMEDDDPTFTVDPSWSEVAEIIRRLREENARLRTKIEDYSARLAVKDAGDFSGQTKPMIALVEKLLEEALRELDEEEK